MEENRFLRVYQDHKREKERERVEFRCDSRFECLRNTPIRREIDNRFECLRENIKDIPNEKPHRDLNNRFSCLIDDEYRNEPVRIAPVRIAPVRTESANITYLPRPEPKESINTQMKRLREEKKAMQPSKPAFSFESEYHFPELNNAPKQEKPEIKLPESKQKEMIVTPTILPIKKKTMTVFSFTNGKMLTKEVYEDGTDTIEAGVVLVKKPNYSSWASVLKEEKNEIIYYDKEENLFSERSDIAKKN